MFLFCFVKGLAAFLKAIGYLIPLMDAEYANYYTREVMLILIREFQSPDEEMKKIVLKVRTTPLPPPHHPLFASSFIIGLFFLRVGGEAVLCDGRCRTAVYQRRNPPSFLQTLLEPENGP